MRTRRLSARAALALAVATLSALVVAAPAAAAVTFTGTRTAADLARAIEAIPVSFTTGVGFDTIPPSGSSNAEPLAYGSLVPFPPPENESALPGFPRIGGQFAIMTNGNAGLVNEPSSDVANIDLFGGNVRGNSDFDVSVLHISQRVTPNDNCLSVEFRFLTEEFPGFVSDQFNDTFIAELRTSDWTTNGPVVSAPNNFASDEAGNPVTVNSPGETGVAASRAVGTVYGAGTRVLRASAPLTASDQEKGSVELYLSILDHGNANFDSAALVDNVIVDNRANCPVGARPIDATDPPQTTIRKVKTKKKKATITFQSPEANAHFFCRFARPADIDDEQYEPCVSPFKGKLKGKKKFLFEVVAVDPAGNTVPQPATAKVKRKGK